MPEAPIFSSPLIGIAVTLGNFAVWLGLASSVLCVVLYWAAMLREMRRPRTAAASANGSGSSGKANGKKNGKRHLPPSDDATAPPAEDPVGIWARRMFYVTCFFVVLGSVSLWSLIFGKQYPVHYIWKNTNNALPFGYRFATFWSDQQGTFFLWGLYNTVLGGMLIRKARAEERWVMPFFGLINVSLFTLLVFMNPFWMIPASEVRSQLVQNNVPESLLSFLPTTQAQHLAYYFGWGKYWSMTDGRGLNESLQNFWMVIHPPTLFVGYSSTIVAGCFALGALMKRDYDTWVHSGAPWVLFSWGVLAIGIFLGAYWAYETLGWGGYWSWDPVENSSIIPWLFSTALVHGMLGQRNRGNFKQANLFLGVMTFVAVLLSSFLVRSGVLGETSVHAFASPQQNVFYTLLAVLVIGFVMGVGIWLWRYKDIQAEIAYEDIWERHFGFFLGLIVLSASAAVIAFGVTLPIWKPWFAKGSALNVDYTFYNKALLPVMFVTVLLMGLTPLMPWKRVHRDGEAAKPLRPFNRVMLSISAAITLYFLFGAFYAWKSGFQNPHNDHAYLGFGLMMAAAILANLVCLKRAMAGGLLATGPWLAHIGFLVMLLGVVVTSRFNTTQPVSGLAKGESKEVLGRKFTYQGRKEAANPQDRDRMLIDMERDGKTLALAPKLFISKMSGEEKLMAWPQILHEWFGGAWGDIYVEPSGVDMGGSSWQGLAKDTPTPVRVQYRNANPVDEVVLTFEGLDTDEMQKAMQGGGGTGSFNLYARVKMHLNGEEKELRPALRFNLAKGTRDPIPVPVAGFSQGMGYSLVFQQTNLDPNELKADFALIPDVPMERGHFQVLHVPGIHILWWGCYVMFIGAFFSWRRRAQIATRPAPAPKPVGGADTPPAQAPVVEPVAAG
jgi:cytochrome c-type biogenesis protein CcmF